VLCPLSSGRRLPRSQAALGVGRVSRLDQEPDSAHHAGSFPDDDVVAAVAAAVGRAPRGELVAASTVEPAQDAAKCLGPGTLPAAAPAGDSARSGGLAGRKRQNRRTRSRTGGHVSGNPALGRQPTPTNAAWAAACEPAWPYAVRPEVLLHPSWKSKIFLETTAYPMRLHSSCTPSSACLLPARHLR